MNIVEQLKDNYDEAEKLWDSYKERLEKFRATVKNDVASIDAAGRRTTEASQRMCKAYGQVITMLNSEEMRTAVENAERLAAAMESLSRLKAQELVFSVQDKTA